MILLDVVLSCVNKCAKSCLLYLFEQDTECFQIRMEVSRSVKSTMVIKVEIVHIDLFGQVLGLTPSPWLQTNLNVCYPS